jgi:hypothetical protein
MAAAAFTDSLDRGYTYGYTVVWIDLENHHTVEGIVAEFFDKVRVVDPQAPTCTITDLHSETAAAIEKAVGRIREVFQRGRYVLVLDSVESFGRPQMMHHGMPSYDLYKLAGGADADGFKGRREQLEKEFTSRVSNLAQFIDSLLLLDPAAGRDPADHPFWDSYVVVTVADPRLRYRHRGQESEREPLTFRTVREKLIRPLRELDGRAPAHVTIHRQRTPGYAGLIPDADRTPATPDPSELLPRHWQYHGGDHARAGSRNSVERAKDVVGLVRELRSAAGSETRISPEGTAAFVGLLSVFRRPRTLPMLRSIVERWALRMIPGTSRPVMSREAHDAIDRLLATIVSARASPIGVVAQFHEGGAVWLFREVHEAAYDALTEALHARDWIATWRKRGLPGRPPGTSASGAVIDGLISVTWHLSAARTYYADVFMPTRDIRAFYEYLYHRVAAARTITLLIAIIEADRRRVWGELARDLAEVAASDGARGLGGAALPPLAWYAQVIGVFAPNIASATQEPDPAGQDTRSDAAEPPTAGHAIPDVGRFLALLNDLRRHALETLLMALTRNRLLLRAVATPDTVLAWSRQFLDRELDDIQGTTLRLASGRRSRKTLYDRVSPAPDVQEIIDALRDLFGELQFKARLSKLDFEGMLRDDARGIGPPAGADNLDNLIQALVEERSAAVRAAVRRVHTAARAATPRRPVPAPDVTLRRVCSDLLRTARCLVHLRHAGAGKLTQRVLEATRALPAEGGQALRGVAKRQRRDALELSCKARFAKWPLWQPLLDRSTCDSRLECPELHAAEAESVAYEHTLREMSETNEDDARHRSSALALRARSLYLRGHFRQAHHFLDLASAGLMPERLDHRTAIGVVHLLRAELLALSANEHYGSGSRHDQTCRRGLPEHGHQLATVMLPLAAESLKKIERGEQELGLAEESLRGMAHQTIWLIPLEFGWAQLRLERMLFECESLFWERRPLAATEYLQRSGGLEQLILDGMRRLRGVLDVIPYRLGRRDETGKSWRPDSDASVVQAELMLYKLWRQFFVAGAYHSTLLSSRHANTAYLENGSVADISRHVIPSLTGRAVSGPDAARYRERWKLWCSAMRFEHFGGKVQLVKSLRPDERLPRPRSDSVSLRSAIIQEMRDECGESDVTGMWNTRREKQPTRL